MVSGGEGARGKDESTGEEETGFSWGKGRKMEIWKDRNERALLLLIIGGVMCQHSLRGFPPEGMIPRGLRHWNHITARFLRLQIVKEEQQG